MKQLILILIALCCTATGWAQGPNNTLKYYKKADGKSGAELKTALYNIIKEPSVVSYGGLRYAYQQTDVRPDGMLRDWYSNITSFEPGSAFGSYSKEGDAYNREHTMCQSWFESASPMYSDIVQVIPTDGYINNMRNDYPYGEVKTVTKQSANGYSKFGPCGTQGYTANVFEPNDEVKGDIARIYFYMTTCYEDKIRTFTKGTGAKVIDATGTDYQPLQPWVHQMMMRWSAQDPVDDVERQRNNAVYGVQGNRNPFVDYPGLERYVWGEKLEEPFSYHMYDGVKQSDIDDSDDPAEQEEEQAVSGTIKLCSDFFGVDWNGTRPDGGAITLKGTQKGVTVIYDKGAGGQNMYCRYDQIRLYKKNTLTLRASKARFSSISFSVKYNDNNKLLLASTGQMNGYKWQGDAYEVVFTTDDTNGNIALSSVTYDVEADTGIRWMTTDADDDAVYNLSGQRVSGMLRPGIYIKGGRKIIIKHTQTL